MESVARSSVLARAPTVDDHRLSSWTRTVAVIRIPRFNVLESIRWKARVPEDPLAAFATETEINGRCRRRTF
jgi:hypothetical protein